MNAQVSPHDRTRRQLLALGGSAALGALAGCTLNDAPRRDFHVLHDIKAGAPPPPVPPAVDQVLLLDLAGSTTLYESDHMVYSADGVSRSYFQFAQWSERPARSLLRLAETRLADAKHFRAVALSSSGVRGDLLLTLRLDELFLDDSRRPSVVTLAFTATLLDWRDRRLMARRRFEGTQQAATRDAAGTAAAANQLMGALLSELTTWVAQSTPAA